MVEYTSAYERLTERMWIFTAFFLITTLLSCNKITIENIPAAQAVSGIFAAKTYQSFGSPIPYPINGQTIQLQIDPVAKDTVRVQVNSTQNGIYSPGEFAVYPKVYVQEKPCTNCGGVILYTLSLAPPLDAGTLENSIWFDAQRNAYYTYIPPGYNKGAVQTVFVKLK